MASRFLTIFFLLSACNAIFFGGGGCGCHSGCGCQPLPPPPPCACAAPPPPSRPCYPAPPRYPVAPVAPPPLPVAVGSNAYSVAAVPIPTPLQEKVAASSYPVEPVPIDKPVAPKYDTGNSYISDSVKSPSSFKPKADADDYEILSSSGYRRKPQKKRTSERDSKCNNRQLRIIIHKSIHQSLSTSQAKISISAAAKEIFGYNFDVICAEKPFTFSVSSELYCELSVGDTFCLAFKH